ncbi:hypothetical protein AAX29_01646 [Aliarcobacter thereius]|uniref:Regulator of chromosome condensation (RCC1) repeat protein n=1 Tax=Aliarcobacter thereius TaxID=544718 RepID=A0A1C0B5S3_9BACT|nr:hypothetical protein [Aliarcobacter thereius]OCL98407.1 hypothetical protein AAX29_01646 [Aliarcobacter thereius]
MKKVSIFILIISLNLFANSSIESLNEKKIEKLIQKEEQLAIAYRKYLVVEAKKATRIEDLKDYLVDGFDFINPFGIKMNLDFENGQIVSFKPKNETILNSMILHYYSNKNRNNTLAPLDTKNNVIIELNNIENFIQNNSSKIVKYNQNRESSKFRVKLNKEDEENKKTNDNLLNNVSLEYFGSDGKSKYSYSPLFGITFASGISFQDDNLQVTKEVKDLNIPSEFMTLGVSVFDCVYGDVNKTECRTVKESIAIGPNNFVRVNPDEVNVGKTVIQFYRRAGGMLVNGDIYAWGNNGKGITGIEGNKSFTGKVKTNSEPVINAIMPLRAKLYTNINDVSSNENNKYYAQNYFNSPKRPKFIDFFISVYHGNCGISTLGEVYCGGTTGGSSNSWYDDLDSNNRKGELLYRSNHFDGSTKAKKAKKIFANNQIWHFLAEDGKVYVWGSNSSAFGGGATVNKRSYNSISGLSNIDDITYILTIGFRRIGAIDKNGAIYIWGTEATPTGGNISCNRKFDGITYNFCSAQKVVSGNSNMSSIPRFISLKGGIDGFIAQDENGDFYKISQSNNINDKIQIESIKEKIKSYNDSNEILKYDPKKDNRIISADIARTIDDLNNPSRFSSGVVWVNEHNELKGDIFFNNTHKNDKHFNESIKKIKWTQVKVIQEENGICGIDVNHQMYCWGIQAYYRNSSGSTSWGNTYMIPVFNTNLYDLNKDFLVLEGASDYLTAISSGEWVDNVKGADGGKEHKDAFFMKYPTYIGGFNYEYEFK